jgi:hypothetical protein
MFIVPSDQQRMKSPCAGAVAAMSVWAVLPSDLSRPSRAIPLLILTLFLIPHGAPAHPPSDMRLSYDQESRVLSVSIAHLVADPTTHYIKRVLITSGGSIISDNAYTSQPSPESFTYTYPLSPAVKGEVQVTAECSLIGSLSRSLQVPEGPMGGTSASPSSGSDRATSQTEPAPSPTKAGPGILSLSAALATAVWLSRR